MTKEEIIINAIRDLPNNKVNEVLDFIQFIKRKHKTERLAISIVSERSLENDWLRPEEDEAWEDL